MDMVGWYVILAVAAIAIAIALRFVVYTMLVKNSRWLPEKATKVANIVSGGAAGVALLAIVGKALLTH
ncbi:MAG: hypothetical protein JST89_24985 [Cyanobacteria bacterium SZAS-4]|nr:hypothetical protein [Cyanobacteria bacterium SZAS-4]